MHAVEMAGFYRFLYQIASNYVFANCHGHLITLASRDGNGATVLELAGAGKLGSLFV